MLRTNGRFFSDGIGSFMITDVTLADGLERECDAWNFLFLSLSQPVEFDTQKMFDNGLPQDVLFA